MNSDGPLAAFLPTLAQLAQGAAIVGGIGSAATGIMQATAKADKPKDVETGLSPGAILTSRQRSSGAQGRQQLQYTQGTKLGA